MIYAASSSKYKNKRCQCLYGHNHRSIKEASRCNELNLLMRAGEIRDLKVEVPYVLLEKTIYESAIKYYADFDYWCTSSGKHIVEDTKGMKTDVYKIKRKLFRSRYPEIEFIES